MAKTKILVVDDRTENITALSRLIESDDIEVFSATTADEALELLMENDFALAILDVQMPVVSGFELARLIRGVKKFRNLPVMFVTAHIHDQSFIFEGYETGAVDLMFKPLDPHVVRSKVRAFVQIDQQNLKLKNQMEEMERLRVAAESANLAKSRFLANMSHEIRTPLGAVMGFADVILQGDLPLEEREQYAEAIRRNGKLLLRIIDDILDFSKIEAQRLDLEKVEFQFDEIIPDVASILKGKAEEKGIGLKVESLIPPHQTYFSDPVRIKQILLNVIGNAVKFTSHGEVNVKAEIQNFNLTAKHQDKDRLVVTVQDSGLGMTKEQSEKLFQPFSQADASTKRQFGGTGLGLVIARQLAKALGGDLHLVSSEIGKGSVFELCILLDKKIPAARPQDSTQLNDLKGQTVLIVDDMEDNRFLIEKYLQAFDLQVLKASSGEEALEMVPKYLPDLILMDVEMTGIDGCEATRKLRQMGHCQPILALTGHSMHEEIERCRQAGCDLVLSKPVNRQLLLESLQKFLSAKFEDSIQV